jgi:hypothetical protein
MRTQDKATAVTAHRRTAKLTLALAILLPRLACADVVYDETIRLLRQPQAAAKLVALTPEKIASMPPEERASAQKAMRRMRRTDREYHMTDRSESVDGRACRI